MARLPRPLAALPAASVPRGRRDHEDARGAVAGEQGRRNAAVRDGVPAAHAAGPGEGGAGPGRRLALGGLRGRVRLLQLPWRAVRVQAVPPRAHARVRYHLRRRARPVLPQRHLQRLPGEHGHPSRQ
jgi:hypothetical protein